MFTSNSYNFSILLKVSKLGPKAFEQCAGFLRIPESKEILDNTGVHPESYAAAKALLNLLGCKKGSDLSDLVGKLEAYGLENEKKYPWMPAAWNRNH